MRPLTITLLFTAVAACFMTALAPNRVVEWVSRLVYVMAFVGSLIAFARVLPRTGAIVEPDARPPAPGRTALSTPACAGTRQC